MKIFIIKKWKKDEKLQSGKKLLVGNMKIFKKVFEKTIKTLLNKNLANHVAFEAAYIWHGDISVASSMKW